MLKGGNLSPTLLLIWQQLFIFFLGIFMGAASSRDDPWQCDTDAIFAAGSRSHQVKIIFL
jgi:hypothetical protein